MSQFLQTAQETYKQIKQRWENRQDAYMNLYAISPAENSRTWLLLKSIAAEQMDDEEVMAIFANYIHTHK